jgi:hypothetical protein
MHEQPVAVSDIDLAGLWPRADAGDSCLSKATANTGGQADSVELEPILQRHQNFQRLLKSVAAGASARSELRAVQDHFPTIF